MKQKKRTRSKTDITSASEAEGPGSIPGGCTSLILLSKCRAGFIIETVATETIRLPAIERPAVELDDKLVVPARSIPEKSISIQQGMIGNLTLLARKAAGSAYAPYSKFHVGAAVVMADDPEQKVFTGCNVENASYGATVCAERNAIFSAVAHGFRKIAALALSTADSLDGPLSSRSPCGICRQVIREFADKNTLIAIDGAEEGTIAEILDIERLLPYGFVLQE